MPEETEEPISFYERRLQREIEQIEIKLKELTAERDALRRQLMKVRWERHHLKDVSRKNSAGRVLVEQRIVNALKEEKNPINSKKLLAYARIANFSLKENTFRTYLYRMKKRGIIKSVGRGLWKIEED